MMSPASIATGLLLGAAPEQASCRTTGVREAFSQVAK